MSAPCPVFALLDDAHASADAPTSRLCTGLRRELVCTDPATLDATCAEIDRSRPRTRMGPGPVGRPRRSEDPADLDRCWAAVGADQQRGLHAVLLADYEWGVRLQFADSAHAAPVNAGPDSGGAFTVLLFDHCEHLDTDGVARWLDAQVGDLPAGFGHWQGADGLAMDQVFGASYREAIDRIHDWIRAGETYQVNHTVRLHAQAWGDPRALYRRLRQRQPVPYGALIHRPDGRWVLSCSPELFVRHDIQEKADQHDKKHDKSGPVGILTAKPMKGTAARQAASGRLPLDGRRRLAPARARGH